MALRVPPEWAKQEWLWVGFPHDAREWPAVLAQAQEQIANFANAVAESGQKVRLLVRDEANANRARQLINEKVFLERRIYGDIWLRDTGPIVVQNGPDQIAKRFGFNGWGGKYLMHGDTAVGAEMAQAAGLGITRHDWVLEGGAIDSDGVGICLTTEQCLLGPNRNPQMSQTDIEAALKNDLGFERIVWLGEGLVNDHTDGHVDNLARFVAPGRIVVAQGRDSDDPNQHIFDDAAHRAEEAGLEIVRIPSAGLIKSAGAIQPASYANFVITNHLVAVPTFGVPQDDAAIEAIRAQFPKRETVGIRADAILAGGGGLHCASIQMPKPSQSPGQA